MGKLIIEGNQVYEIDEECMRRKRMAEEQPASNRQRGGREQRMNTDSRGNRRNRRG